MQIKSPADRNRMLRMTWAAICLGLAGAARAQTIPDQPNQYIVDTASVIGIPSKQSLNRMLRELESRTGAQLLVLTLDSTDGVPIRDFSREVAHNRWRLGQADENNGVLVVVAVKDRKYAIEVGTGLQSVLTDGFCGRTARRYMVPAFKENDYTKGIFRGTCVLIERLAREYKVEIAGLAEDQQSSSPALRRGRFRSLLWGSGAILMLLAMVTCNRIRREGGRRNWAGSLFGLWWLSSIWSGIRRHTPGSSTHHTGSFWSGGGFTGGFGGGGGGSFSGGGTSGGW